MLRENSWALLPTGAGSARSLERATLARVQSGGWLPDGTHIAFTGWESGQNSRPRIYVQSIEGGAPRPISPEGAITLGRPLTGDGRSVLGFSDKTWRFYPIDGGDSRAVPALTGADDPIQQSADGTTLYATTRSYWGGSRDVFRIDLATGRRSLWKTLAPADAVGIDRVGPVVMTPDARAYCYSSMRRLGTLFTVDGLK